MAYYDDVIFTKLPTLQDTNEFIRYGYDKCIDNDVNNTTEYPNMYPSMVKKIQALEKILKNFTIDRPDELIAQLIPTFMPPGLKGVLRGNRFNSIIFQKIQKLELIFPNRIKCECEVSLPFLSERADFVITDMLSGKRIVGYNQLDMWEGGAQTNRGDKYILSDYASKNFPKDTSLLYVVSKFTQLKTTKSKKFKIIATGINNKCLVYPNQLIESVASILNLEL